MNNPDHISGSSETIFWFKILKFCDADPGSGMEKIRIRDGKNLDLRSGTWDKHPGYATLGPMIKKCPSYPSNYVSV